MGDLLIDLKSEFQPGCLRRGATKRGCVKVRHVHSKRACQVKLISVPWPFCCIFAYSGPLAPWTALKKGERLWCFNCPPLLMWRRWFGLAESNTCRCRELCCSGLPFLSFAECKKKGERNVIWRASNIWHTMTLCRGNSNHLSSPSEKRKIRRYDTTGCLHRKQRGMTVHGFLNKKKQRPSFKHRAFPLQKAALSRDHQCQKLGTEN